MKASECIETARLILERPHPEDAEAVFARYASDPDVARFVGWPRHKFLSDTAAFLEFSKAEWDRWPAGPYLIRSRADGTLLGSSGLAFETPYRASTGYVLSRDAWGKGYATEALRSIVGLAQGIGIRRLYAICHIEHRASCRILEKCGFLREGVLRHYIEFPNLRAGELSDVFCYALVS